MFNLLQGKGERLHITLNSYSNAHPHQMQGGPPEGALAPRGSEINKPLHTRTTLCDPPATLRLLP